VPDRRDATGPRPLVDDFEVIVDDATPPPGDLSDSQRRQWVLVAALRREVVDLRDKVASHDRVRGVLVKVEKPGQEARADRPTIGLRTVLLAAETGLRGIAVEANATIVLDRGEVICTADRAGLFLVGLGQS